MQRSFFFAASTYASTMHELRMAHKLDAMSSWCLMKECFSFMIMLMLLIMFRNCWFQPALSRAKTGGFQLKSLVLDSYHADHRGRDNETQMIMQCNTQITLNCITCMYQSKQRASCCITDALCICSVAVGHKRAIPFQALQRVETYIRL